MISLAALREELGQRSPAVVTRLVDPGTDGAGAVTITDVTHDSRAASAGTLFACLRGAAFDGHDYA